MNPINALMRTPDVNSLTQASERAPLSLLAAAALCARNVLIVEYREVFDCPIDEGDDEDTPSAVCLVALEVHERIDALLDSLRLYDATLRDHLHARRYQGMPF